MSARLHVMLGAGGVGKTTLAAGLALALAARGARVGLLGIDPSRRLEDALGVHLGDDATPVPDAGTLTAAIVEPQQAIRRWTAGDPALVANPFFAALGDRLATGIDVLAAARIAEWLERDPTLTDLVVDTAPGVAAIDFVRSPRRIAALIEGPVVRGLRAAAAGRPGRLVRRMIGGFARIAGVRMIDELADLFARARAPLEEMLARVERTRGWLAAGALRLVTSPRDTGAAGARAIARALAAEKLAPCAVIVNRTWPAALGDLAWPDDRFGRYLRAQLAAQVAVLAAAPALAPRVIVLPSQPSLARRDALRALGDSILERSSS